MEADILAGQAGLQELLGVTARTFAYPCGQDFVGRGENCRSYTPIVAKHFIAGRRFREETFNDPSYTDLSRLAGTEGDRAGWETVQGFLTQAVEEQGWIVLALHDIGEPGPHQTFPADTLERLCAFCADKANGVWQDTVEDVADYILANRQSPPGATP